MSGLVRIEALCPICEAWCVTVEYVDVPWPEAGEVVEQAIDAHVGEHVGVRVEALTCGCTITIDERRDLAHLTPCSVAHRNLASANRQPGSRIIVRGVDEAR